MEKNNNKKGFTLAELLVVVAIIAVLVAVAIPALGNHLEKAREATDVANIRGAYADAMAEALVQPEAPYIVSRTVKLKQTVTSWQTNPEPDIGASTAITGMNGTDVKVLNLATAGSGKSCTISIVPIGASAVWNNNSLSSGSVNNTSGMLVEFKFG